MSWRGCPFPDNISDCNAMFFVDGENLAIRYYNELGENASPNHVVGEKNVFVWSRFLNMERHTRVTVIRRHYYTSVTGDNDKINSIYDRIKATGIEAPQVFKRTKDKGSKRVDISIAVDMLGHAHRRNYDVAVLVAGDEDYVPLVEAIKMEGRRVFLWFLENGLSPELRRRVDYYYDIKRCLFAPGPR